MSYVGLKSKNYHSKNTYGIENDLSDSLKILQQTKLSFSFNIPHHDPSSFWRFSGVLASLLVSPIPYLLADYLERRFLWPYLVEDPSLKYHPDNYDVNDEDDIWYQPTNTFRYIALGLKFFGENLYYYFPSTPAYFVNLFARASMVIPNIFWYQTYIKEFKYYPEKI